MSGPTSTPLLVGSGLGKRYGGVVALEGVSLSVEAGRILGLVGPNGAGKTTLVDVITGAQKSDSGELVLAGRPLRGGAAKRGRLGLARTFQYPLVPPDITVLEAIVTGATARRLSSAGRIVGRLLAEPFLPFGRDYERAQRLCEELGLSDLDRLCGELSLGELRLLEVVRATVQDPLVMLLDEPFAGTDHAGVRGTVDAIRMVQARGHAIVLVDHNVDIVAELADRVLLLDRGRVVFDGAPADCLASSEMRDVYFGGN